MNNKSYYEYRQKSQKGFSLPEVMIVVLIMAIIATFALMRMTQARSSFQLSNVRTTLQAHLEKAFTDAKRRHAQGNDRAKVQVTSSSSYDITIDFNGDGVPETRTITLPSQVTFVYNLASPPKATFDWRGNIAEGDVSFTLRSDSNKTSELKLTSQGDSSIDKEAPTLPVASAATTSADVKSSIVLTGDTAPNLDVSPTPTPTPLPYCLDKQQPAANNCRCQTGKTIDKNGECN